MDLDAVVEGRAEAVQKRDAAPRPGEPEAQDAAAEERAKLLLDMRRHGMVAKAPLGKPGLEVAGDDSVERCSLGAASGVLLGLPVRRAGLCCTGGRCRRVQNCDHGWPRLATGSRNTPLAALSAGCSGTGSWRRSDRSSRPTPACRRGSSHRPRWARFCSYHSWSCSRSSQPSCRPWPPTAPTSPSGSDTGESVQSAAARRSVGKVAPSEGATEVRIAIALACLLPSRLVESGPHPRRRNNA